MKSYFLILLFLVVLPSASLAQGADCDLSLKLIEAKKDLKGDSGKKTFSPGLESVKDYLNGFSHKEFTLNSSFVSQVKYGFAQEFQFVVGKNSMHKIQVKLDRLSMGKVPILLDWQRKADSSSSFASVLNTKMKIENAKDVIFGEDEDDLLSIVVILKAECR